MLHRENARKHSISEAGEDADDDTDLKDEGVNLKYSSMDVDEYKDEITNQVASIHRHQYENYSKKRVVVKDY